jgi:hypothetical protein
LAYRNSISDPGGRTIALCRRNQGLLAHCRGEGASPDAVKRIGSMKKGAMAEAAAQLLEGKNWLPPLLRTAP